MNDLMMMKNDRQPEISTLAVRLTSLLFLPGLLLYMEITAKLFLFGSVFDSTFIYMFVLSLSMGALLSFAAMLFSGKPRRIFMKTVLAVWFSFHAVYQSFFHTLFSWQSLGQAGDVSQFWREAIEATLAVWYLVLAFFVPLVVFCALGPLLIPDSERRSLRYAGISAAAFAGLYLPMLLYIHSTGSRQDDYTPYYYYTYLQNDLDMSFRYYGVFNATRLDVKQLIFGAPVENIRFTVSDSDENREYGANVMEIDFEKAAASTNNKKLKAMDEYFGNLTPTRQNEYTGLFKDKNLVMITLEAFSEKLLDPEYTPMLYKMSTKGFVFNNFYNTLWGGSTATGEYAILTGNFYNNTSCLPKSAKTYQPFTMANQLSRQGYKCIAYHNHYYKYYDRQLSHPNFGYQKWKAVYSGMELKNYVWPNSDLEMAEVTVADYVNLDVPFHVYYMTVSGHGDYSYVGNNMATRHRNDIPDKVKHYAEDLQAYYACQCEAELMIEKLVEELEKAGKLQDTVFAIEADHFPYALSAESLAKLYGLPKKRILNNFELYRNRFILWTPSMEKPVTVDDYCSTIDIYCPRSPICSGWSTIPG